MASDGSRGGLPPIAIVDDVSAMRRNLETRLRDAAPCEPGDCAVLVRPDGLNNRSDAAAVVEAVGKLLSHRLRPYDGLYRFGDEMYLVVLMQIKPEDAVSAMDRLRCAVSDEPLEFSDGGRRLATVSLGGAMLDGEFPVEDNLERAGEALRSASMDNGNAHRLWSVDTGGG